MKSNESLFFLSPGKNVCFRDMLLLSFQFDLSPFDIGVNNGQADIVKLLQQVKIIQMSIRTLKSETFHNVFSKFLFTSA